MTLFDRLRTSRHDRFVGRSEERTLFAEALAADPLPFHILYLFGPGGVGKTALLREFSYTAEEAAVPVHTIDGRDVGATPEAFEAAVGEHLPASKRAVLLVDTYEALDDLDEWLRTTFLPQRSEEWIVVLAGRTPPDVAWRSDLGWREVVRLVPLRNLTPDESRRLLDERGVPEDEHEAILRFTRGHPLALALAAEHRRRVGAPFDPGDSPDVVGTLLKRFLQDVEGEGEALTAAAAVRVVTEALLADLLERDAAHTAFASLRDLSFVEARGEGLVLHELVREVIAADLRWRRPDRYDRFAQRARAHYTRRLLSAASEREQQAVLADYAFLYRHNALIQPVIARLREHWREAKPPTSGGVRADEWDVLRAFVAEHEGEEAAAIAAHWFELQPERVQVFRDADGQPAGFLLRLALEDTTEEERAADPAATAAWTYLDEHAPLRAGERATHFRFWLDAEHYQDPSVVQSLIFVATVRHYLRTPGLAFTLLPCAAPDFWATIFSLVGLRRIEADFEVGGRTYGVYGHDWRAVPPAVWLQRLAEQGLPSAPDANPVPAERLVVLSRPDFAEVVRDALRDFARPHELAESPLLRSRLVAERTQSEAPEARVEALRALIDEAAEELNATPREAPYYLALDATYLDPARTQAEAAEQLDMPFSSFRRYLKRGVEHVVQALWEREVQV